MYVAKRPDISLQHPDQVKAMNPFQLSNKDHKIYKGHMYMQKRKIRTECSMGKTRAISREHETISNKVFLPKILTDF